MKIEKVRELVAKFYTQFCHENSKQTDHSLDIDFKDFMNLCKKCTAKPYPFLVIDATLASDNPLPSR